MLISDLVYIDSFGYHYADFPTFLTWVQSNFQQIYGADVYLGNDSQDGQWTSFLAQAFYDTAALGASIYNSFSPTTAQGVGLSRVVQINGIQRNTSGFSTVELVLVGVNGTTLSNAIAIDTNQQQWSIPTPTTIPGSGTITVTATAIAPGAITALPNTITGIFTPTNGWQSVNNPAAATPGAGVEIDAALRTRQSQSVANPSLTVFEGTLGAVRNVSGVITAQGYENPTNTTDANGLPPHSISVVASGGLDSDVASAIQVHKTPGAQTYGSTTVLVDDSHGMPIYINFYRPTNATINAQVTITPLAGYDSSFAALIQAAISAAILAVPTNEFSNIGIDIVITKLYPAAYLIANGVQNPAGLTFNVVSIEISKNANPLGSVDVQLLFNEIPVCIPSSVVVVT